LLNIFKNDVFKKDLDWWIGFTSYRQLDKTPIIFKNKPVFENMLYGCGGFAGWGFYMSRTNCANLSELCHPHILSFIYHVFSHFGIRLPERFYSEKQILFANYWAMRKDYFVDFMSWSWPIMQFAMTQNQHPYAQAESSIKSVNRKRWIGYFMERLFIIWYMSRGLNPANFGPICGVLV